jgi:hypothetical protein
MNKLILSLADILLMAAGCRKNKENQDLIPHGTMAGIIYPGLFKRTLPFYISSGMTLTNGIFIRVG